jgi:hypothetical protein
MIGHHKNRMGEVALPQYALELDNSLERKPRGNRTFDQVCRSAPANSTTS